MSTTASTLVPRRWIALIFIALAQLMVVLDATIVNIALPSAQRALDISDANRQWIITAYTLAFGGLLLFGGRVGDLIGRRRAFLIGLLGFAGASAVGGAAVDEAMLLGARALQGAFGALLAPSALSLLAVTFTVAKERAKAFGIYGAIAGGGAAIGLILGGLLTEYLNWRWALYVNVPIAVIGLVGALAFVRDPAPHDGARLDVPGVVLVTGGLVALVYGFTRAESEGWSDRGVVGLLAGACVLIVAFVVVEALTKAPLLPLRVILDRNRGGAYLAVGLSVIGMFGLFLFMTYYLQTVKHYSPVRTGLAFLPLTAGMITGSTQIAARLMNHVPARLLMVPGLLVAEGGIALLLGLRVDSAYAALVLPSQVLLGIGLGTTMMPAMNLATLGVDARDAGVASAMVNTSQQVGGSLGTALLNTVGTTAATGYIAAHAAGRPTPALAAAGLVHGFQVALWWAMGAIGLAAIIVAALVTGRGEPRTAPARATTDLPREASGAEAEPPRELAVVGTYAEAPPDEGPQGETRLAYAPVASAAGPGGPSGPRVRGRVRGADGGPVTGAALTLIDLGGRQVDRAVTGPDGAYALRAPGGGPYMLITAADGHQPRAATVVLGDDLVDHDVTLSGTASLSGAVRAAVTGRPVAGAVVVVTDAHGEVIGSAETGDGGGFVFEDLVAGTYVVAVSAGGHRPAALPVEVGPGGTTRCEVELPAGARVHGTVRAGSDDLLLADARVTLVDAAGDVVATATTGPDGAYAFEDLDPGPYTVIATGYPPVALAVQAGENGSEPLGLTLRHPTEERA
ncbi:DHA2 family efflux MFS transporter permease subunit [Actinoallomurus spadix]|uniref:MFS transporter n=1 Tax=Actinoallomurus spadix TaxID=79912 RepID=UPI002093AA18|nr:MFS transporter [Actinoallomurus spadix]MCO5984760.1 DHA2 family efflux MFS transporter permease subunit [Actinoallomurus spadix]